MTITIPEIYSHSVSSVNIEEAGLILLNQCQNHALPARFRALFTLRGASKEADRLRAIEIIGKTFNDPSALLKHELAYVMGQMQCPAAVPYLNAVLADPKEDPMVRHECAEALGAIGLKESIVILQSYLEDPQRAVRETCEIAIRLIQESQVKSKENFPKAVPSDEDEKDTFNLTRGSDLVFGSVDPAPPMDRSLTVQQLRDQLLDISKDLFTRYKAMFALRNRGTPEAVLALCEGFSDESALFRHEIAYVLGQLQHPDSVHALSIQLRNRDEVAMVRHECAEALGSIATVECLSILSEFENDQDVVVRESCIVARDMYEYENGTDLHMLSSPLSDGLQA